MRPRSVHENPKSREPGATWPDRRRFLGSSIAAAAAGGLGTTSLGAAAPAAHAAAPARGRPGAGSRLVLLGTLGGPPPEPSAFGIATALVVRDRVYVIDCGRGAVSQYVRSGLRLAHLSGIFVTHLHADHVSGYYDFFLLGGFGPNDAKDSVQKPVPVYGPGPAGDLPPGQPGTPVICPDAPTPGLAALSQRQVEAFAYQTNLFMRYSGIPDPRELMRVREIDVPDVGASALGETAPDMEPFFVAEDDLVRVTATLVPHGPVFPSFAYRFDTPDGSVVFSGDTTTSRNVERLAHGADILVHEAIDLDAQKALGTPAELIRHLAESHTSVDEVGPLAERAGVTTLVLSHLMPTGVPASTWRRRAQRGFSGKVVAGEDLAEVPLERRPREIPTAVGSANRSVSG